MDVNKKSQNRNYLWMLPQIRTLIEESHLIIIGCGGNGIAFLINAVHVGFRKFTLCDQDLLEEANFNRYIIALPEQIGNPKVEVASAYLKSRFPDVDVQTIQKPFPNLEVASALKNPSLVVGCLDNADARIQLDLLCRKHKRTLIDLGSGFVVDDTQGVSGYVISAGGQILVSRPENACLRCLGFDIDGVFNNYFINDDEPEPSSLLLNNIISALAVECVINELIGHLSPINRITYDRQSFAVTTESNQRKVNCQICGRDSFLHIASIGKEQKLKNMIQKGGLICRTV